MLRTTGPKTIRNEVKCFGGFNELHQYINDLLSVILETKKL